MDNTTAYEIQVYRSGEWRIQAFVDDRDLAMQEATRLREGQPRGKVRIVATVWNSKSQTFDTRILFCEPGKEPPKPRPTERRGGKGRRAEGSAKPATTHGRGRPRNPAERRAGGREQGSIAVNATVVAMTATVLVAVGLVAGYAFRFITF